MATEIDNSKHSFSSGATSSENKHPYHLVHLSGLKREAARFGLGKTKHGDVNYQKCVVEENGFLKLDLEFVRDRYDHMIEHAFLLKEVGNSEDDNLGAVRWATSIFAWLEHLGFDLKRILTPVIVNEQWLYIKNGKLDRVVSKSGEVTTK